MNHRFFLLWVCLFFAPFYALTFDSPSSVSNSSMFEVFSSHQQGEKSTEDSTRSFIQELANEHTEGQWFLGYRYGEVDREEVNLFTLKRGYITLKNRFNERWSVRFTQDITLDQEGSDRGNVELRLKYCYLNYTGKDFWFFTSPSVEVGLVHRPWLDFEQKINPYRVQGTMFLERAGLMNSADFGLTFTSLLGGEMDERYQKRVNSKYPGRYGSLSVGLYNGGGYHALEQNQSKNIEGRLTLRPFPQGLPGLQLTYNMVWGKGNTGLSPDFILHSGFVSYESRYFSLTGQYYEALGNSGGSYASERGRAYHNDGYSFFSEYRIPHTPFTLFGRYDHFNCRQRNIADSRRIILGAGYYFYRKSKLILDLDALDQSRDGSFNNRIWELAVEIRF